MSKIDYTAISFDETRKTFEATLTLPKAVLIKQIGQKSVYAPLDKYPPAMLVAAIVRGLPRCLNDSIGGSNKSDADKLGYLAKKLDAHLAGSFDIVEREAPITVEMRDAYIAEQLEAHPGEKPATIEAEMRKTVKAALGDVNATFPNFLLAVADGLAKREGEKRTRDELATLLTVKYEEKAQARIKARAEAAASFEVKLDDFDI